MPAEYRVYALLRNLFEEAGLLTLVKCLFREGRVAYKIQEEAFGTKLVVQTQMARIGEAQSRIKTQRGVEVQVVPGTVLVREFDRREHRVTAQADGTFEYEGRRYKSLSAVARHITGTQWSGPLFFGITKNKQKRGAK